MKPELQNLIFADRASAVAYHVETHLELPSKLDLFDYEQRMVDGTLEPIYFPIGCIDINVKNRSRVTIDSSKAIARLKELDDLVTEYADTILDVRIEKYADLELAAIIDAHDPKTRLALLNTAGADAIRYKKA